MKTDITVVIKPKKPWEFLNFFELWQYRDLFYIFTWRDITVRYKQTALGILWVIFQPLLTTVIFTIFFGNLAKIPSDNLPYALFVLCGLVYWNYFSGIVSHASNAFIENESIVKKIYFPRIILPLSSIFTNTIDFSINIVLLLIIGLFFRISPSLSSIYILPVCWVITSIVASGVGLFLASLNVKFRDVRYILPFFIQLLLFVTPVIYPLTIMRPSNRLLMSLNPMTGVVTSVRTVLSGSASIDFGAILFSLVMAIVIFFIGLLYFNKTERFFADII